jgi:hypothetical protein
LAQDEVELAAQIADPACAVIMARRQLSEQSFKNAKSMSKNIRALSTTSPAVCPHATDTRCAACPIGGGVDSSGAPVARSVTPTGADQANGVGYGDFDTDGFPDGCNCLIKETTFAAYLQLAVCREIKEGVYAKVSFNAPDPSSCVEPQAAKPVKLKVQVSISVSIDFSATGLNVTADALAAALVSGGSTSGLSTAAASFVTAFRTSLITAFADAMSLDTTNVKIKTIAFATPSSRKRKLTKTDQDMTVEYEVTGIDNYQSAEMKDQLTNSAATLATSMQTTINTAVSTNTALSSMMDTVTVDSSSFTTTESDDVTTSDDAASDDSDSGAFGGVGLSLFASALMALAVAF